MDKDNELQVLTPGAQEIMHRAEVESQMDIARRYPRKMEDVKKEVLEAATCDEDTARRCFYIKPVGRDESGVNKNAEGPSIRLAEIVAAMYGNITHGTRVIEIGNTYVKVQGMCKDLQKNNSSTAEVTRSIVTKTGKKYSQNNIDTTIKAAQAIALRDAIFKVVPLALFQKEMNEIKKVAAGSKSGKPLTERITMALKHFQSMGVSEKRIFEKLDIQGKDELSEDHLVILIGLANAIKDQESTIDDCFPITGQEKVDAAAQENVDEIKKRMSKTP